MVVLARFRNLVAIAIPAALFTALLAGILSADDPSPGAPKGQIDRKAVAQGPAQSPRPGNASRSGSPVSGSQAPSVRGGVSNAIEGSSGGSKPVLKVYRCEAGAMERVAETLRDRFGANASVRLVTDARTSQVLVMAPPEIQAQIAAAMSQGKVRGVVPLPPTRREGVPDTPPSAGFQTDSGVPSTQVVQLQNSTAQQFEAALVRTLGERLTLAAGSQPGESAYQVELSGGQVLAFSIDRNTHRVRIRGAGSGFHSGLQLIGVLDSPPPTRERTLRLVSLGAKRKADIRRTADSIRMAQAGSVKASKKVSPANRALATQLAMVMQPQGQAAGQAAPPGTEPVAKAPGEPGEEASGILGTVQIEQLEGLDMLVISGHQRDVERVLELIGQIEEIAEQTKLDIQVLHLKHVDCRSLGTLLEQIYEEVFSVRQGDVSITALSKPNALLLIGREENVATVVDLTERLDRPVPPSTQFQVFRLKNNAAETVEEAITELYPEAAGDEQTGLGPRVQVTADFRTNSVVVRASPRDLMEVTELIARLDDAEDPGAFNEVYVCKLKNALAEELAPILQDALTGQMYGQKMARRSGTGGGTGQREDFERKSIRLQFITTDGNQERLLNSGILADVQITAEPRSNALVVTASSESMPLIRALIEDLDTLPTAEAEVKVFTLVNSDAASLVEMLQDVFGEQARADQPAVRTGATEGDSSLVPLTFSVDVRTNSIIASGSTGDLTVVEAILLRLDEGDLRSRVTEVFWLKNAPALDVAEALDEYLQREREVEQSEPGLLSAFEQIEREVVIVPEAVSNGLIVSATSRYFEQIAKLIDELDRRPPMVMIQVLIAEVRLNDTDEFGVELGLQDSILFDRSVAGVPGFLFNSTNPLGNNTTAPRQHLVGSQGLTNLAVGRLNNELGYGGLVLSASSESLSVLVRALRDKRRVDVLARPQIMTMDNQLAEIIVGQEVPTISGSQFSELGGQQNVIEYRDVGLILTVTPRISPDNLVVMEIDATNSTVGPEEEGIPVSVSQGQVVRSPRIDTISARTVVSAADGQTVVLGGLITTRDSYTKRTVPWLGDLPLLGNLFRYEACNQEKNELLIIMTPHVVTSEADAERIRQIESARMDWCLCDVIDIHGSDGFLGHETHWEKPDTMVIYPDQDPTAQGATHGKPANTRPEPIPIPNGSGSRSIRVPSDVDSSSPQKPLTLIRPHPYGPGRLESPLPTGNSAERLPTK